MSSCFPKLVFLFQILPAIDENSGCCTSWLTLGIINFIFKISAFLSAYKAVSTCGSNSHFLDSYRYRNLFLCLLDNHVSTLVKWLFKCLMGLKVWSFCFLLWSCEILYILDLKLFGDGSVDTSGSAGWKLFLNNTKPLFAFLLCWHMHWW